MTMSDAQSQSISNRDNFHALMMECTGKIRGSESTGTCFVLGKPKDGNGNEFFYTLITAAHVFDGIKDDAATLVLRTRDASNEWHRVELPLAIRKSGAKHWTKHPEADVAAMHIAVPPNAISKLLPTTFLFTDSEIAKFGVQVGTELLCLGYPLGAESQFGFPILRSGRIASYPLLPTKEIKVFNFDFTVFPGNSGGPVYLATQNLISPQGVTYGGVTFGILGLVSSEQSITQHVTQLYETRATRTPLSLGQVVPAQFIREVVDLVPLPTNPDSFIRKSYAP